MHERIVVALMLLAPGALAGWGLCRLSLRRAGRAAQDLPGYRRGRPAILTFTPSGFQPCRTVQRPALERLRQRFGRSLQVVETDASPQTRLADAWGVLGVPINFLPDARGRPGAMNHGVTSGARLASQLAALGERPPDPSRVPARPAQARG